MALITNLQAYWKLDEASGNPADSSGNAFTLTNTNTVAYAAAKINNGATTSTSNTNKNLNIAGSGGSTLGISNSILPVTFNFWVNINTLPSSATAGFFFEWSIGTGSTNNGTLDCQYFNNAGTPQLYISRNANTVLNQSAGVNQTLTVGTWYMMTLTYDGSTVSLYLNGSSSTLTTVASSQTGTTGTYANRFTMFSNFNSTPVDTNFLSAIMDEFGVWTRVLSSTEITQLYNAGLGLAYPFSTGSSRNFKVNLPPRAFAPRRAR